MRRRGLLPGAGGVALAASALLFGLLLELPEPQAAERCPRPSMTVRKAARVLELTCDGRRRARFRVSLGRHPQGPKRVSQDGRTPEGDLYVCTRNEHSRYNLFLGLAYPTPDDAARGLRQRLITPAQAQAIRDAHARRQAPPWNTRLGGAVGIHGLKNGWGFLGRLHRLFDWTDGCIAVRDAEIERLWRLVPLGTPVRVEP